MRKSSPASFILHPLKRIRYKTIVDGVGYRRRSMTQQDLANVTQFTQGAISKMESDILDPSASFLGQLLESKTANKSDILDIIKYYTVVMKERHPV